MENTEQDASERERQLDAIVAEYYRLSDAGQVADQSDFIQRNPEFASELKDFFSDARLLHSKDHSGPAESVSGPTIAFGTSRPAKPAAGSVVRYFGEYEILEQLGAGGMGVVYKARQSKLKRIVALKMIRSGELANSSDVHRFEAEAKAAAKLSHSEIVSVHEVGIHNGHHFYTMDYVEGGNLSQLHRDMPVPVKHAVKLVRQIAEAMHYAHLQGIVHRDLKPANILLTVDGEPRITDFGLAKRVRTEDESQAQTMTESGQILGTAGYMSPEQAAGKSRLVGPMSDVYSLGAVLYALLTSRAPFVGETPSHTIMQVLQNEPISPRKLNPSVPRDLETVCLKCLEKEPHKRYGTAQLLADDLSAFLGDHPIAARPIGYIGRTAKWVRRHRVVSSLLLLTCLSIFMGTAFSVHFGISADQRAVEADNARTEATKSLASVELSDYLNRIALAQAEWESDNVMGCEELLDTCPLHLRGWEWNYLKRVCYSGRIATIDLRNGGIDAIRPGQIERFRGIHAIDYNFGLQIFQGNCGLAFSADGRRIFTRTGNSIKAWDAHSGKHIQSLGCKNNHFAYDPTRNTVLVDNRLVNSTSFQERLVLLPISNSFSKATFSADGTLLAVGTSPIMILNQERGELLWELPATEGGEINSLAFSPSNSYIAVAREDVLQVWSLKSRTMVFSEPYGGTHVTFDGSGVWLISDNTYLLAGNDPLVVPGIRIWKVPTFQLVQSISTDSGQGRQSRFKLANATRYSFGENLVGPCYGTRNIAVCPLTQRLAVLSWDNSIRLFDLDPMIKLGQMRMAKDYEQSIAIGQARTATGSTIRLRSKGQPFHLAFDAFGKQLATIDMRGILEIWDISHPPEAREYGTVFRQGYSNSLEIQQGDSAVAFALREFGDLPARLRAINLADGSIIDYPAPVIPHDQRFHLSKDGRVLGFKDAGRLHVQSVFDGKDLLIIDDVDERKHRFRLDENGHRLAFAAGGRIRIFDVVSRRELCEIVSTSKGLYGSSESIKFDPSGEKIAINVHLEPVEVGLHHRPGTNRGVEVWDATTARLIAKVPEGQNLLFLDERLLMTSKNDVLTCWSLPDGEPPFTRSKELNTAKKAWTYPCSRGFEFRGFQMSGDYSRIAVSKNDTTIIVLDSSTGKVMHEVSLQANKAFKLNYDGSRMILYKTDGRILLHHIDGDRNPLDLGMLDFASAQFTSDGSKIIGVSEYGIVRVLDGTPWEVGI